MMGHGPPPQLGLAGTCGASGVGACGAVTALGVAVVVRSPASHRWPGHSKVLQVRASGARETHQAWRHDRRFTGEVGHRQGASVVEKQWRSDDGSDFFGPYGLIWLRRVS
jgi:hypothetical protein